MVTILVHNVDEAILEIISSILTSSGYQCRSAATAATTLNILNGNERIDLVLCGHEWTDEDFKLMRATFSNVPVVLCTSMHNTRERSHFTGLGACDTLLLPFTREELKAIVSRALDSTAEGRSG